MPSASAEPILVLDADAADIVAELQTRRPGQYLAVAHPDELVECGAEICLGSPGHVVTAAAKLKSLRWVQSTWAGTAPLLPLLGERPELVVTGVKGIFGPLMAEYVFGWIAALERRLFAYREQQARRIWRQLPERPSANRHMVILGVGSIGRHLAAMAGAFGLTVTGVSRSGAAVAGIERVFAVTALGEAVAGAHYLVSVLPDTPETRDLIDAEVLAGLAPGAVLINVGRGTGVVDADVIAALQTGVLSAAVLDVFREEPLPPEHPFWTTPNLYLTPHVAAVTPATALAELFLDNLARFEAGQPLAHRVDAQRGY
ncbi:MAG: D-2-hydroxyacid dehydrogenase [Gammaproteobacteria bacterium]|nr:D-2-hydroxyacid dehydrogenase [Gammaproteobacteria bacterium]